MSGSAALLRTPAPAAAPPATSRLLARTPVVQRNCAACGSGTSQKGKCPACEEAHALAPVQAKLTIGAPDDPLEKEADEVADRMMRMPATAASSHLQIARDAPQLRSRATSTQGAAPPTGFVAMLKAQSGGAPLSAAARSFFEPRFARDLGHVRIHHDSPAGVLAKEIHASAFASGSHIFFAPGQYQPASATGRRLLAHEIAHAVQQGAASSAVPNGPISRQVSGAAGGQTPAPKPLAGENLKPPGDCHPRVYQALKNDVKRDCKTEKRACLGSDLCPTLLVKMERNAKCIRARARMNSRCFRGGDQLHVGVLATELGLLASCWAQFQRCAPPPTPVPQPKTQPVPVPVPVAVPTQQTQPAPQPVQPVQPVPDRTFMEAMEAATGLTGTALIIYIIISEGSRLFPPRNLIPAP